MICSTTQSNTWLRVDIGIVGTASEDILTSALAEAVDTNAQGLIINLDTPGGALEATRGMVKVMMAAPIPVVVWVGPAGARAGSAGAFITLAGHIAAMAEGTNIGAAHPVAAGGQDLGDGEMSRKVENDAAAFMESIALARKRDPIMARSFVVNSLSITASEALEGKVIDLVTPSISQLMQDIHGREVSMNEGSSITLVTSNAQVVVYQKSIKQRFLEILSNPNLFYLLFIAGLIGIGFELTHPGSLFPGVIGAISLILALIATSVLPVNFGAMLLVVAAVAFMAAEAFLPSFGILGIGGLVAFVVGSFLLIDSGGQEGLGVHWTTIVPVSVGVGAFTLMLAYLIIKADRSKVRSGAETLAGTMATAYEDFVGRVGRVRLQGEIWQAQALPESSAIRAGDELEIVDRKGLTLTVRQQNTFKPRT
jgi:membrane-bound serine protease (ClpP class)